ncbi:hypothetical protein [Ornithinibacillus halophilus]|uniref:hypothetical protein n=1 Tax=Ornithinibacillus halophilus TaxID=930117 RepID=UPI0013566BA5|nr:hypothetical protein [Ornithinibacillus halophilus]
MNDWTFILAFILIGGLFEFVLTTKLVNSKKRIFLSALSWIVIAIIFIIVWIVLVK